MRIGLAELQYVIHTTHYRNWTEAFAAILATNPIDKSPKDTFSIHANIEANAERCQPANRKSFSFLIHFSHTNR